MFPKDAIVDTDLLDLFKRTFTAKDNRLSARQMKNHPWIVSNCYVIKKIEETQPSIFVLRISS